MKNKKEMSTLQKVFRPIVFGTGAGVAVCVLLLAVAAAILAAGAIPPATVTPVALAVLAIAAVVSGFVASRVSKERGLLYGAGAGLLLFLLTALTGIILLQEFDGALSLLKAALTIGGGAVGGVLGVNAKKRTKHAKRR